MDKNKKYANVFEERSIIYADVYPVKGYVKFYVLIRLKSMLWFIVFCCCCIHQNGERMMESGEEINIKT